MTYPEAALLGAIQGLTEFLPVSSSAHLALVPRLLGLRDQGLAFDVALHLGTLAAAVGFYADAWKGLLLGAAKRPGGPEAGRLALLAAATVPAAAAGAAFGDAVEETFRDPRRIAWALLAFSLVMEAAQRWGRETRDWDKSGWGAAMLVGAAQALAIVPGVSRSGVTVSAGLLLGLRRESAAQLSFLLSAPVIAGAAALKLRDLAPADLSGALLLAVAVSALTGWAAVRLFLGAMARWGLRPFALYRAALAAALLAAF